MAASFPVLAVTGLIAESRIAAGTGVVGLPGGGDPARLSLLLQAALAKGAMAVISFGIAGGLEPGLKPGMTLIGRTVLDGSTRIDTDADWRRSLQAALPHASVVDLVGVDHPVCGVAAKSGLHKWSGAAAVDMESHIAARLAALHGLPFAALRVVADPAERTVPQAAAVGMRPDGSTDTGAVLRALGRRPGELPGLIRTAFDARAAFSALTRNRRLLRGLFGLEAPGDNGLFGTAAEDDLGFPAPAKLS